MPRALHRVACAGTAAWTQSVPADSVCTTATRSRSGNSSSTWGWTQVGTRKSIVPRSADSSATTAAIGARAAIVVIAASGAAARTSWRAVGDIVHAL